MASAVRSPSFCWARVWVLLTFFAGSALLTGACGSGSSAPLAEPGPRREESLQSPGEVESDGPDVDTALSRTGENAPARVCRFQARDLQPGFSSDYYSFCVDSTESRLVRENVRLLTNARGETVELARLEMLLDPETPAASAAAPTAAQPSVHALIRVKARDGQVLKDQAYDALALRSGVRADREVSTLRLGEGDTIRLRISCFAAAKCAAKH